MANSQEARTWAAPADTLGAGSGILLISRILLAAIFFISFLRQIADFPLFARYMLAFHVPAPMVLLPLAMIFEIVCSIMLVAGIYARWAALAFACYTLLLACIFHAFWAVPAQQFQAQLNLFLFHLATIGGMLYVAVLGPGSLSIDRLLPAKRG